MVNYAKLWRKLRFMNLIFDFDGVIADSQEAYDYAVYGGLKEAGFRYSLDDVPKHTHLQYFETIGLLGKSRRNVATKKMVDVLIEIIKQGDFLYKGAKEALGKLKKKHKLFVVSNSYQVILDECVKFYGLDFTEVVGRSRKFLNKEKAIGYLLKKYKINKSDSAYVGDSTSDIELAKNCGIKAIGVASGWNTKEELLKKKPDKLYDNIMELSLSMD